MRKLTLFFALFLLTACAVTPTAPTDSPAKTIQSATAATVPAYPAPAYPAPTEPTIPTAYPAARLTVPPTLPAPPTLTPPPVVTPSPTQTETPEPTPPPLVAKVLINELTLFDANTGWAVQAFYTPSATEYRYEIETKIIRTTAGFKGWRDVSPPPYQGMKELGKVFFLDANTAVGFYYRSFMPFQVDTELTGARTVDGGKTWQVGETMHFDCCLRSPVQTTMLDANHGWMYAVSEGAMGGSASLSFFRTSDGGLHWEKVYDSDERINIDGQNTLFSYAILFGRSGFALIDFDTALYANGSPFRSDNGGKNWTQVELPIPPAADKSEQAANEGKYQPGVTIPQFWTKTDGVMVGRYYGELLIPPTRPTKLPEAEFLYYTHDGGKTWDFRRSPARIGSPFFLDSNTGWYLGKNDPDPTTHTQLYHTTDGGQTWSQIVADCPLPLGSDIHFLDSQTGYALLTGYSYDHYFDERANERPPYFFFTQDGGLSWEPVELAVTP